MSHEKMLIALDRIPRYVSLLGLFGLVGLAGILDPQLYRWSVFSFLSYFAFFRYFRCFVDPTYGPTKATAPYIVVALAVAAIFPWLISVSPMLGFVGFAGCCGLYDPRYGMTHSAIQ